MSIPINKNLRAFLSSMTEMFDTIDKFNGLEQAVQQYEERLRSAQQCEVQSKLRADEFLLEARNEYRTMMDQANNESAGIRARAKSDYDSLIAEAKENAAALVAEADAIYRKSESSTVTTLENEKKIEDQNETMSKNATFIIDQAKRLKAIQDNIASISAAALRTPDGA